MVKKYRVNCSIYQCFLLAVVAVVSPVFSYSEPAEKIINEGVKRIEDNRKSQINISKIHNKTLSLIDEYEESLKIMDGLNSYNSMMKRQVARQKSDMEDLRDSINNVSAIERQVMPLLMRMLDSLDVFIDLDVPFLLEERRQRIAKLQAMMDRVDVSVAEKSRRVFEAFQIETEYGRTIESYRDKLAIDSNIYDVDYLRIGRISLMYRIVGTSDIGYWDGENKKWMPVGSSAYRRYFEQGVKVAKREMAPELIMAPVMIAEEISAGGQ